MVIDDPSGSEIRRDRPLSFRATGLHDPKGTNPVGRSLLGKHMTLSRLVLNPRSRQVARDLADCQELHRTVLSAFPQAAGGSARQRFGVLFRIEYCRGAAPVLLIQSHENPDFSALPSGYLAHPPTTNDIGAAWRGIARDSVFRFRLRANPTRKIETKSPAWRR